MKVVLWWYVCVGLDRVSEVFASEGDAWRALAALTDENPSRDYAIVHSERFGPLR